MIISQIKLFFFLMAICLSCRPSERLNVPQQPDPKLDDIEHYIYENLTKKYGINVKYKFHYANVRYDIVPPTKKLVKPYVELMEKHWVQPYLLIKGGKHYFSMYAPNELVLAAKVSFEYYRQSALGSASGGAVILLTRINAYDLNDVPWVNDQLYTLAHEFAHIQHQVFDFPLGWKEMRLGGYSQELKSHEALERGFITSYAAHNMGEDFAETVAVLLFSPKTGLRKLVPRDCNAPEVGKKYTSGALKGEPIDRFLGKNKAHCERINEGRKMVKSKMIEVKSFYQKYGNIDLHELRDSMRVVNTPLLYTKTR